MNNTCKTAFRGLARPVRSRGMRDEESLPESGLVPEVVE